MGLLLISFAPCVRPGVKEQVLKSIAGHMGKPRFLGQGRCAIAAMCVSAEEFETIACDLAENVSDSGITGIDWFGGVGS